MYDFFVSHDKNVSLLDRAGYGFVYDFFVSHDKNVSLLDRTRYLYFVGIRVFSEKFI